MNKNKISGKLHDPQVLYPLVSAGLRVHDMPKRLRPRELVDRFGVESVPEDVLVAILLRSGVKGVSVIDLARQLLNRYRSLTAMSRANVEELVGFRGVGKTKAQVLKSAFELAKRLSEEGMTELTCVKAPEDAAHLLREKARTLETEVFWVLLLNTKNALKCPPKEISRGLLDASLAHAREVFRDAIQAASSAIVLVHNHPSGDPKPSTEDITITKRLIQAGDVIDIRVLDHIILGKPCPPDGKDFVSMREDGIVQFS
ncbi:DNA repair protein RadC [Verrucomicrobiota bacterium]